MKHVKKELLEINNIDDFTKALIEEGYYEVKDNLNNRELEMLYSCIKDNYEYRAKNIKDFMDYIKKIVLFEDEHKKLCEKLSKVKELYIERVEYEREPKVQENVEYIIKAVNKIRSNISEIITEEEKIKLQELEREIDKEYIYAKDIELLKKMLIIKKEDYNYKNKIKTIVMEVPKNIKINYMKPTKGTIEYHMHLNSNIPRIQRLTKNIYKYLMPYENNVKTFIINQSKTLQDSINISLAIFDDKEFKAISGSNEIENYCTVPLQDKAVFKSSKVNRLGKLGIGYNRVKDSEKKIFEEIHRQIEEKLLKNQGELILYSKWEPCLSCYYVISQFCDKHPNIKVSVKYIRKYGEIN